jgi:tetratricopeptide (TPR) repeat protein
MGTRIVCCAIGLALLSVPFAGQTSSDMDRLVTEGRDAMYRLDYDLAIDTFGRIIEQYPESPVGYGMMSTATWNDMVYRAANPTLHPFGAPNPYVPSKIFKPIEREAERFHQANDRLLDVCEEILAADPTNVLALYFKGLAFENRAAEAIVISDDRWGAVGPGREARKIHNEVLELDPDFIDAKVSVASYEYALATVDGFAKLVLAPLRLFGFFRGDKEGAFRMMEEVTRLGRYRSLDAQVVLSVMHAFEGDPNQSIAILDRLAARFPSNYMIDFSKGAIQELRLEDGEAALSVYRELLETLPQKTPGLGEAEVRFRIGKTQLGLERYDEARAAFERAIDSDAVEEETRPLSRYYLAVIEEEVGTDEAASRLFSQFLQQAASMESLEEQIEDAEDRVR